VFGYEEALGYEVGDAVSDKDGLSAALVVAEIAAAAKADGTSVTDRLDSLASRFGVHATAQWSLRLEGRDRPGRDGRDRRSLAHAPAATLAGLAVTELVDLSEGAGELPATDALVLRLGKRARVVMRPSAPSRSSRSTSRSSRRPTTPSTSPNSGAKQICCLDR